MRTNANICDKTFISFSELMDKQDTKQSTARQNESKRTETY